MLVAPEDTVRSPGQVSRGASWSFTVTVKEHCCELPAVSLASQVTDVGPPKLNAVPGAGLHVVDATSTLSLARGSKSTTAVALPSSVLVTTLLGHVTAGFSLSYTVTTKEHDAVLPSASAAEHTTLVLPTGNTLPDACVHLTVPSDTCGVNVRVPASLPGSALHAKERKEGRK